VEKGRFGKKPKYCTFPGKQMGEKLREGDENREWKGKKLTEREK